MQNPSAEITTSGDNHLLQQGVTIPIDLNWRKKYYRKVLWIRIKSLILDFFIIFLPLDTLIVGIFFDSNELTPDYEPPLKAVLAFLIIFYVVYCILCAIFESSKWQGTPGKLIMKIQVIGTDGYRLPFFRALLRNLCKVITLTFWIFTLPFLIYNGIVAKRFWHDRISKTDIGMRLK
jgi:uncharacterized RDD family membrane protein YckC